MTNHGLTSQQVGLIQSILSPYAHSIEKVCLFGSRAKGTYRPNSDIDLVIYGRLEEKTLDHLGTLFQESSLPISVDIQQYHQIPYDPLKAHIDRVSTLFLTHEELLKNRFDEPV
ncbi:MAG: nucleotidyltransferase domain-containing protein [Cyanobacteria bacterium]|nr:nucleotidyltransferase domain-containing protein [Cyanobacteriota bacterium]